MGRATDSNGVSHAAVWLLCPNYGRGAEIWHDLSPTAEIPYPGLALGINDAGIVVGGQTVHAHAPDYTRAYVWDLATSGTLELATFADGLFPGFYGNGVAYAVNNASPAVVVGSAQFLLTCGMRAFGYKQGDPPTALSNLGAAPGDTVSEAWDVNDSPSPAAAGVSDNQCSKQGSCDQLQDAVTWSLGSGPGTNILPDAGALFGARAYGLNSAGSIVGAFWASTEPCRPKAAFWLDSNSAAVDLGAVNGNSPDWTIAYKLKSTDANGATTVVGANLTAQRAWRWHRDAGGNWTGADLNTLISPACGWFLAAAYDISDDGWIVGEGGVNGETHGFLLRPVDCFADLSHDCVVNGSDLGILLSAWNACSPGPCAMCAADLNLDASVDGADLGALLAVWGTECSCWTCPGESESAMASGESGQSQAHLETGLAALGFDSVAAFTAWQALAPADDVHGALDWLFTFLTFQQ